MIVRLVAAFTLGATLALLAALALLPVPADEIHHEPRKLEA